VMLVQKNKRSGDHCHLLHGMMRSHSTTTNVLWFIKSDTFGQFSKSSSELGWLHLLIIFLPRRICRGKKNASFCSPLSLSVCAHHEREVTPNKCFPFFDRKVCILQKIKKYKKEDQGEDEKEERNDLQTKRQRRESWRQYFGDPRCGDRAVVGVGDDTGRRLGPSPVAVPRAAVHQPYGAVGVTTRTVRRCRSTTTTTTATIGRGCYANLAVRQRPAGRQQRD
jgi:hypothetical protein